MKLIDGVQEASKSKIELSNEENVSPNVAQKSKISKTNRVFKPKSKQTSEPIVEPSHDIVQSPVEKIEMFNLDVQLPTKT